MEGLTRPRSGSHTADHLLLDIFARLRSQTSQFSQRLYRITLKPVLEAHGHRLVRDLPKTAARNLIEPVGATRPGRANTTRAALSQVIAMRSQQAYALIIHFPTSSGIGSALTTPGQMQKSPRTSLATWHARAVGFCAVTLHWAIPIHPALARALQAGPVVGMHHIITDTCGQPLRGLTALIERAVKLA
jgi:hypothetical protein